MYLAFLTEMINIESMVIDRTTQDWKLSGMHNLFWRGFFQETHFTCLNWWQCFYWVTETLWVILSSEYLMLQDLGWEVKFTTLAKHFPNEVVSMDPYVCVIEEIHEEDILMDLIIIRRSARKQISVYKLKRKCQPVSVWRMILF